MCTTLPGPAGAAGGSKGKKEAEKRDDNNDIQVKTLSQFYTLMFHVSCFILVGQVTETIGRFCWI